MNNKDVINKVENLVLPVISENNFELVDIEFVKEGPNWYLRVFIDKQGGITIDDCEIVSRNLEAKIEKDDFIEQAYIFEVSSPGIDRVLKKDFEFEKYKGKTVDVKLYKPINKCKEFQGELLGLVDNNIVIKDENNNEVCFDKKAVAICRLAVIF